MVSTIEPSVVALNLRPWQELDEFGIVTEFLDYVSDTFPRQTDLVEVSAVRVSFLLYNYTEVVHEILAAKLRKVYVLDHRLSAGVRHLTASLVPDPDPQLFEIKFPERDFRTARTLPAYRNLARTYHYFRSAAIINAPCKPEDFEDVSHGANRLRAMLTLIPAYQITPRDVSRGSAFRGVKTGTKPWTRKKR